MYIGWFTDASQVESEILNMFDFLSTVYGKFGFTFKMKLSTRPEGHLGDIATWDKAEAQLKKALDEFTSQNGSVWELNPGDGAFYGPKIDITISDALKREFQCATIQLDFQLPQQFNLEYRSSDQAVSESAAPAVDKAQAPAPVADSATPAAPAAAPKDPMDNTHYRKEVTPGCARPVMIHRAVYGSFERFLAILIEHFAGKWPFWLSPRQVLIVPVMPAVNSYVLEVQSLLREQGLHADVDLSGNTMQKKIRTAQLAQYNFIFVLGAKEEETRTVNIRNRDIPETQKMGDLVPLKEAIEKLVQLRDARSIESKI